MAALTTSRDNATDRIQKKKKEALKLYLASLNNMNKGEGGTKGGGVGGGGRHALGGGEDTLAAEVRALLTSESRLRELAVGICQVVK